MRIDNISNNTNFNGLLKFKTSSGTKKLINPKNIAAVITGTVNIKQAYYLTEYNNNLEPSKYTLDTPSPEGRYLSGITKSKHTDFLPIMINQINYINPLIGRPDTYKKLFSSDYAYTDLKKVEGNDLVIINENTLAEAINEACTTDKLVDITDKCGQDPLGSLFSLEKIYAPLVINNNVVMNADTVACVYMASAEGIARAEKEIGAKNVICIKEDELLGDGNSIIQEEMERLAHAKTKTDKIDRIEKIVKQYNNDNDNAYLENAAVYIDELPLLNNYD